MQKICKYCKKPFQGRSRRTFCTSHCFYEWRKEQNWEDRICKECGKTFKYLLCLEKNLESKGYFCSQACYYKSNRITLICKKCGKEFTVAKCHCSRKYCSQECAGVAKKAKAKCICIICESVYYVIPSKVNKTKCCSIKCQHIYCSNLWSNKRTSRSDLNRIWRIKNNNRLTTKEWKEISKSVKERDGNKCTQCGSIHNLIVHHIIPWTECRHDKPENLITLCRGCHMEIHKS